MNWVISAITTVAAIIVLIASRPANRALAIIAAVLMIISGSWTTCAEYQRSRAAESVTRQAFSNLSAVLANAEGLLNKMLIAGSDEWIPATYDERFSEKSAQIVCNHLNLEKRAPIVPDRTWLTYITQETKEIRNDLDAIIRHHADALGPDVLNSVAPLRSSFFLKFPQMWSVARSVDRERGYQRPPLLCYGLDSLMHESLGELKHAVDVLAEETGNQSQPRLDTPGNRELLGAAHYSAEDLQSWVSQHPFAPSGQPPE